MQNVECSTHSFARLNCHGRQFGNGASTLTRDNPASARRTAVWARNQGHRRAIHYVMFINVEALRPVFFGWQFASIHNCHIFIGTSRDAPANHCAATLTDIRLRWPRDRIHYERSASKGVLCKSQVALFVRQPNCEQF
eukprot:6034013-Amphidinium_carterae.2